MHSPSILSNALAVHLLFMIPLLLQGSSATDTGTVQDGDTFLAIADSADIPVESLEAANPGVAASALYVGQVINIPTNDGSAAGAPLSNPAVPTAAAAASTGFVTLASPPVMSPSGSPSAAPSASASGPSSDSASLIAEAGLAVETPSASMSVSSAGSSMDAMTDLSSATSSPIATSSPSTAPVASSPLSSTAAAAPTSTSQAASISPSATSAGDSTSTSQSASSSPSSTAKTASSSTSAAAEPSSSATASSTSTPVSPSSSPSVTPSSTSTPASPSSPPSATPSSTSPSVTPSSTSPSVTPSSTSPSVTPSTTSSPSSTTPTQSSTTPSSTPNSSPVSSCAPNPPGKYHDVTEEWVHSATDPFCEAKKDVLLEDLQKAAVPFLDGSQQGWNDNDGSKNNEAGFNMTIRAIPNCSVENATVEFPLPDDPNTICKTLLFDAWRNCDNEGMGGTVTAGCFTYLLLEDH